MEPQDDAASPLPAPAAASNEETPQPTATTPPPLSHPPAPPRLSLNPLLSLPPRLSMFSLAEMRNSILSLPPFKPRWKSWSPARVVVTTLGFAAAVGLLVAMTLKVTKRWVHASHVAAPVETAAPAPPPPPPRPSEHADAALARDTRSPVAGGVLTLPPAFRSDDGAYDLLVHFHGNTELVEESVFRSGLNAVTLIMNLGDGSGPYEDRFGNPMSLPEVLDRVQTNMEKRGLAHASLRRLALSAWSAGYGAVLKVLDQPALAAKVDAVLLLDGIHVGYQPKSHDLILERLAPFERFAREAVEGRRLFSITHTQIQPPNFIYAGTRETTDALLRLVGVERSPYSDRVERPIMKTLDGVMAKKLQVPLDPETIAHRGGLTVRGYSGERPENHMAHLTHMSVTVLPELVAWWGPGRDAGDAGGGARAP